MRYLACCFILFVIHSAIAQQTAAIDEDTVFWESPALFVPYKTKAGWTFYDIEADTLRNDLALDAWIPSHHSNGLFVFKNEGRFGCYDELGYEVFPFEYDTIVSVNSGIAGRKGSKWHLFPVYDSDSSMRALTLDSIAEYGDFVYLYRDGKVGLYAYGLIIAAPEYAALQPMNFSEFFDKTHRTILAFDGANYRFFDYDGNDLLGVSTPEFELMRDNFMRFKKDGRWQYYAFATGETFDSKGNDVVLYSYDTYKIYGPNRTKPTFYFAEKTLSGYDDYFDIGYGYFAFNSGDRIGLMDGDGTVLIPPRYDKLERVSGGMFSGFQEEDHGYFKFFKGDSCGLVTKDGVELIPPIYANIIATQDPDRLIVLQDERTGVVDRTGRIILPVAYDYISYGYKCFLLRQGRRIGLADNDGNIVFEPQFDTYRSERSRIYGDNFYALVFKDFSGNLTLANNRQKLSSKPFSAYNFGNQTFKLYRKGEIEVLVLSDDADIEDRATYSNVGSLIVHANEEVDPVRFGLAGWDFSYLEENQRNGKFGLRYYSKSGIAVAPVYTEVQPNGLSSYFAQRPLEGSFNLIDNISVRRSAVYDQLYTSTGSIQNSGLISAESLLFEGSSRSTASCIVQPLEGKGTIEVPHPNMPFTDAELKRFDLVFSQRYGRNVPKKFFINAQAVLCPIEEAELSLYEYYHYFAILGGLRMTPETAPTVMNPNLGVRFKGGVRRVSNKGMDWNLRKTLAFKPWEDFTDFHFTERDDFVLSKSLDYTEEWRLRDYEWEKNEERLEDRYCYAYREYPNPFFTTLELHEKGETKLIIHEDFPDFAFISVDSLATEYHAGRLIVEDSTGMSLIDPSGRTYVSDAAQIRYLGETLFAVKKENNWRVTDREGKAIIDKVFSVVGSVSDGTFYGNDGTTKGIYTVAGDALLESDNVLTHIEGSFYRVNTTPEVWYDASIEQADTLGDKEKHLGYGVFYKKTGERKYTLHRFGMLNPLNIISDTKPKLLHEAVVFRKKKKQLVYETNGKITYYKGSNPKKVGDFIVIKGKKEHYILNSKGDFVHSVAADADVETYAGRLVVVTSDTTYYVASDGSTQPYVEGQPTEETSTGGSNEIEIFKESGHYGAKRGDAIILPANYDRLYYDGFGEFRATQKETVNLFDAHLDRINPIPYQQCYFLDAELMVLELNGQWYFFRKTDTWNLLK